MKPKDQSHMALQKCFNWLVIHERLLAALTFVLVVALLLQLKFMRDRATTDTSLRENRANTSATNQTTQLSGATRNVAGTWEMIVRRRSGGTQNWTLMLNQNGESLSGTIRSEGGDLAVTGAIRGQEINFSGKRFGVTAEFSAALDGEEMSGRMTILTIERDWMARRQ